MPVASVKFGFTYDQLKKDGFQTDSAQILEISKWLAANNSPELTKEQIVLFLLSCDHNLDRTKYTIRTYLKIKYSGHEVFANRRFCAEEVLAAYSTGSSCLLPRRSADGDIIILYKFKNGDYWNWTLRDTAKIMVMTIESGMYDYPPNGLIILVDMKNLSLGHLLKVRPRLLKLLFQYLQEALPVKLKHMHMFNSLSFLNQILAIMKPLMHRELFEKVHFHPKCINWNEFYEQYVPKTLLCSDYGGELPSSGVLEEQTLERFRNLEEYFHKEELSRQKKR